MEFCIIATGIVLANGESIYHKHRYLVETTRPTLVMSSIDNEPALLVVELLAMNDNKKLSNFIEIDDKELARELIQTVSKVCEVSFGSPTKEPQNFFAWDKLDGNVILQTYCVMNTTAINFIITSMENRGL